MTKEDITRMAREAGFVGFDGENKCLREFAALVRAAERKQILAVLRQMHDAYALASDPSFIKPKGNT